MTAAHYRYRIRLARRGLMRFLGQLDTMRTIERAIRRCGFRIRPREGFRTGIKLSFPLSLALGCEAEREVFQIDLGEEIPEDVFAATLQEALPEGFEVREVRRVPPYQPMKVVASVYECEVPAACLPAVQQAVTAWAEAETIPVTLPRKSGTREFDLKRHVESMELEGGHLRFRISHATDPTVRPIEVLEWLGIADQLQEGMVLRRVDVVLEDELAAPQAEGETGLASGGKQFMGSPVSDRGGLQGGGEGPIDPDEQ